MGDLAGKIALAGLVLGVVLHISIANTEAEGWIDVVLAVYFASVAAVIAGLLSLAWSA